MKKFLAIILALAITIPLLACGNKKIDIQDYLIEERNNLFVSKDNIYQVTLSSGRREIDYDIDGIINDKTDFAILSMSRLDNQPMANDNYTYRVTINEELYTGTLEKSSIDNSYVTDLKIIIPDDAQVSISIEFTGYKFEEIATNISSDFAYNKSSIIEIANQELEKDIRSILKHNKIEVIMKIIKDYSVELNNYYWYIGVVATNGEVLGLLIDTQTGNVVAKK